MCSHLLEWDKRIREDARRFGFPKDCIGRVFWFFEKDSRLLAGAITGFEYGDDGLPFFSVSSQKYAGLDLVSIYPSDAKVLGWFAKTRDRNGKFEHWKGEVLFP